MKTFRLSYTMTADLTVEQIWPDGDAPANPTAKDVERVIEKDGGWGRVIRDWDLDDAGGYGHAFEVEAGSIVAGSDANEP